MALVGRSAVKVLAGMPPSRSVTQRRDVREFGRTQPSELLARMSIEEEVADGDGVPEGWGGEGGWVGFGRVFYSGLSCPPIDSDDWARSWLVVGAARFQAEAAINRAIEGRVPRAAKPAWPR